MRIYFLVFAISMLVSFFRGMKEMRKEKERLRIELGISENDPSNLELQKYIFSNPFRYNLLLFMIFSTGIMLYMILL